nr:LOW QUALITY PROTEIN: uncharacterized protein LOC105881986 [Microcebus murinus]
MALGAKRPLRRGGGTRKLPGSTLRIILSCTTPACFAFLDSKQVARKCLLEWTSSIRKTRPVWESEEGVRSLSVLALESALTKETDNHAVGTADSLCVGCWRVGSSRNRHVPTVGGARGTPCARWRRRVLGPARAPAVSARRRAALRAPAADVPRAGPSACALGLAKARLDNVEFAEAGGARSGGTATRETRKALRGGEEERLPKARGPGLQLVLPMEPEKVILSIGCRLFPPQSYSPLGLFRLGNSSV